MKDNRTDSDETQKTGKPEDVVSDRKITKFLALDKILPRRQFLQVIHIARFINWNIKAYFLISLLH